MIKYADLAKTDLIVMGAQGRTRLEHMLTCSVAAKEARRNPASGPYSESEAFQFRRTVKAAQRQRAMRTRIAIGSLLSVKVS